MGERVAIVGAREHPSLSMVAEYVRSLPPGTVVISGGAHGVDDTATQTAYEVGLRWIEHTPDEVSDDLHGGRLRYRDRCLLRNTTIVVDCDRLVVFPDGSKGGCWDAVRQCKRFGRPYEVRWADGRVERSGVPTGARRRYRTGEPRT